MVKTIIGDNVSLSQKAILCRIDWYRSKFFNVTIDYVINNFLNLGVDLSDTFLRDVYEINTNNNEGIVWRYNGIFIKTKHQFFNDFEEALDSSVFYRCFSEIQLDVSGDGLRYLRSIGFDPEVEFRKLPLISNDDPEHPVQIWRVTRVDFAFDLINYAPQFLQQCINWCLPICQEAYMNGEVPKVSTCGKGGAYVCNPSIKDQALYLGNRGGANYLRIYDKLYESKCKGKLIDVEGLEGFDQIDSYIRIELECKRELPEQLLYGFGDYESIFKYIYEKYRFYDKHKRRVAQFWVDLFDWETIGSIIQNAKWEESVVTKENVIYSVTSNTRLISTFLVFGIRGVIDLIQQVLDSYVGKNDRFTSYKLKKITEICTILQDGTLDTRKWKGGSWLPTKTGSKLLLDRSCFKDN